MVFLALLIIPIVAVEYILDLASTQNLIFLGLGWIIYSLFFAEFALKVLVAEDKKAYFKSHKFYTAISVIIILSPILEPISELFATAPVLRVFRIVSSVRLSRLTRLAAASGRARLSWRRVNFKTYAIVAVIIAFGFSLSFFTPRALLSSGDQNLLSHFIQVIGTIYAIITGFIIANVWNKYTALINAIVKETISLRTVYILAVELKNPTFIGSLEKNLRSFATSAIAVYWKGTNGAEYLNKEFDDIFSSFRDYSLEDAKDTEIFANLNDELRKASEYKANIQSLLASKTPGMLWALLIALSSSIISAIYITPFESQFLATLAITMTSVAVALIVGIIYDMNAPFKYGFWAVNPQPYFDLRQYLEEKEEKGGLNP